MKKLLSVFTLVAVLVPHYGAVAATAPTTATVFTKSYTALKNSATADVVVGVSLPGATEVVEGVTSATNQEVLAILKKIKAVVVLPTKPTNRTVDGATVLSWKKNISLSALKSVLAATMPVAKRAELTVGARAALTGAIKNFASGSIDVTMSSVSYLPQTVTLAWQTTIKKNKTVVKTNYSVQFTISGWEAVAPIAPSVKSGSASAGAKTTPVTDATNTTPNGMSKATPAANAPSNGSVGSSVTAVVVSTHAVDATGQGGVSVSHSADQLSAAAGRDTARLEDLKAIGAALQLYFADQGAYPAGPASLGSSSASCLSSDGWSNTDCPYPYMQKVPADPKYGYYMYSALSGGASYKVTANLEGSVNGLSGAVSLTTGGVGK